MRRSASCCPGFGLTLGFTLVYLSLIVLDPAVGARSSRRASLTWPAVLGHRDARRASSRRYQLTFGASFAAALVNAVFGLLVAWVLVRYRFPGRRLVDALVDLPFALPTAVAGIALTALYAPNGWLGALLEPLGIKVAFTPLGVLVALTFIGLPFVVRTVQPVLEDLDRELEEAAATLGRQPRWQTFRARDPARSCCRRCSPASRSRSRARSASTARSIFISGNMPMKTEIAPLLIITKLEQYDYAGATAIAVVMLVVSFVLLLAINALQAWTRAAAAASDMAATAVAPSRVRARAPRASRAWVRWR